MPSLQLVAVDTNIPLLLADADDLTRDALEVIRKRINPVQILVPPTAIRELVYQSTNGSTLELRQLAGKAIHSLRRDWCFQPALLNAVQEAIAVRAANELCHSGLLPREEKNNAAIVAESAVLNSILLVSHDSHLHDIDPRHLALLFRRLDLPAPIIVTPKELVEKFYS